MSVASSKSLQAKLVLLFFCFFSGLQSAFSGQTDAEGEEELPMFSPALTGH